MVLTRSTIMPQHLIVVYEVFNDGVDLDQ